MSPYVGGDGATFQLFGGTFGIRWYALAYVAGILLGWRYAVRLVRTPKLWGGQAPTATPVQIDDLILWVTLGIILGGRLGYVLFYKPALIWKDPIEIIKIWEGGMSFHGGLLGVIAAIFFFARSQKIDLLKLGDLVAPAVPIGLFFGRIANFINGELWGRPTMMPWGIIFPGADGFPRHPSQLYEAALEGIVLFLVLRWATHSKLWLQRRGVIAGLFLAGYGLARVALENVRQPDDFLDNLFGMGGSITMGMLLSLPMLIGGAWLVWRGLKEPVVIVKTDAAPASDKDAASAP
ncbi:prolipoprotein diacylglyceryl transferase [Caulobacter sp. NIBR1757]|uniref:prolipoprotein diacylglyceryl transferase n=1 Tax=Caulobacter sp. NIBR1757 TaxID=3016000 RepID=UPI0022F00F2D|nr:prolipoprotein diacylglyceryl transferase [Caulobacter sp. NIBR1757]